ncbi:threonine/homoserine/homoserine lactone efflux protein [Rhizobium leguminosarum]|uniref:Threonine/homoserine/homoserine lactone efflux protein n=1 Tax=Rhizobium leguminosarum TaxID=384 RepID=A0AAE2MGZ5_RHILE|nr:MULTISPECIES: LysE family translocator [Rhizobium]MBB4289263.1 threonine/homoserine/homoserine lactone efflux protein [Rhizobium leguminosarum]MBB4294642.1 threonine/homoserine/homoserine lactone efflux protein [Rhizobium leguminosarum]MBB4306037.1 threonine/homoserine/homoserine lactone efflux protein [Rhizobium leguminosarum]MBB4418385.1 threonine/homoserine/homoserine lactone efflux protein [Rhizobium leguminosarum]MBB4433230.1 threonine/homoserine/homoserine lactone efflux protein [Rhiz
MFDYSLAHWFAFLSASVLLNLSPGPDIAFILGHTMRGGKRAGFSALFGVWSGACLHVLMAALGLSAVLAASAVAFSAVKWIGAAYLVWLGIQALRAGGGNGLIKAAGEEMSVARIYRQGILVSLLNPKVAIFFLAFLPQFVVEGAGPAWAQLMLHGGLIIVVAAFIEPPLVLLGGRLADTLRHNQKIGLWLDRGLGALFLALGVRLALSSR